MHRHKSANGLITVVENGSDFAICSLGESANGVSPRSENRTGFAICPFMNKTPNGENELLPFVVILGRLVVGELFFAFNGLGWPLLPNTNVIRPGSSPEQFVPSSCQTGSILLSLLPQICHPHALL